MNSKTRHFFFAIENSEPGIPSVARQLAEMDTANSTVSGIAPEEALVYFEKGATVASRRLPHAIFLDYTLSEMDAVEFLIRLRRIPGGNQHYVTVLGSLEPKHQLDLAYSAGANLVAWKPGNDHHMQKFLATMLRLLGGMQLPSPESLGSIPAKPMSSHRQV